MTPSLEHEFIAGRTGFVQSNPIVDRWIDPDDVFRASQSEEPFKRRLRRRVIWHIRQPVSLEQSFEGVEVFVALVLK